jgi:type I restriction enzyme S subunit
MNDERLLSHYDRIADAPDAVGRLRRFVLDLAVRGKLVAQGPGDEPASRLLERIALEKASLGKGGTSRQSVAIEHVSGEEAPFYLPRGWCWARLGDIVIKLTDGTHHSPPNGPIGDFKYITAKNIKKDGV